MDGIDGTPSHDALRQEVEELRRRVDALEERFLSPHPRPPADEKTKPSRSSSADAPSARAGQASRLESRIGAQWFNRIGIFAVLAGAAWFLKLAIDRAWIGAGLRVTIGLGVAAGLLGWSERFRRESLGFSYTLKALSGGLAYLSLWACFNLYHLLPAWVVFAGMLAVTVGNAVLAHRQSSELLGALALAGGLATPVLLSTETDREAFLFTYLLVLDLGALALAAANWWPRITLAAFAGTTAYFALWWQHFYVPADEALTGAFIALFFGLFTAAPLAAFRRAMATGEGTRLLTGLPIAVSGFAFLEAYWLLSPDGSSAAKAGVAMLLAVVSLGLALLMRAVDDPIHRWKKVHLGLALSLFALAGLLEFDGYGIAVAWLLEFAVVTVACAWLERWALGETGRGGAVALLLLSLLSLLLLESYDTEPAGTSAFLNTHFAVYLSALGVYAGAAVVSQRRWKAAGRAADAFVERRDWRLLSGAAVLAFNLVALLAVSLQIHLYWHTHGGRLTHHPASIGFTYSAWFMSYGAVLMAAGFRSRSAFLRWQALVLLTLSIGKVFLADIRDLDEGYRVASFLGLGVLLLAVSFVYQRDWLELRGSADESADSRPPAA